MWQRSTFLCFFREQRLKLCSSAHDSTRWYLCHKRSSRTPFESWMQLHRLVPGYCNVVCNWSLDCCILVCIVYFRKLSKFRHRKSTCSTIHHIWPCFTLYCTRPCTIFNFDYKRCGVCAPHQCLSLSRKNRFKGGETAPLPSVNWVCGMPVRHHNLLNLSLFFDESSTSSSSLGNKTLHSFIHHWLHVVETDDEILKFESPLRGNSFAWRHSRPEYLSS